jgi:hypothetical protein
MPINEQPPLVIGEIMNSATSPGKLNASKLFIVLALVFGLQAIAVAGKPVPPPPPPPTPTVCGGDFPAYAFKRDVFNGKKGALSQRDLYLANGDGSCAIKVYSAAAGPGSFPYNFSYRQDGSHGRIVWRENHIIRMVDFHVAAGAVVESLPLASSIIYEHPVSTSVGVNNVVLSKDFNTVYFAFEEPAPGLRNWLDSLNKIDLSACSSYCPSTRFYSFLNWGVGGLSLDGNRIYMSIHDRVSDTYLVSFVENNAGEWSPLKHVLTEQDYSSDFRLGIGTDTGNWDYDNDSAAENVLAVSTANNAQTIYDIQILDVTHCAAGGTLSCLAEGTAIVVKSGIAGVRPSFRGEQLIYDGLNGNVLSLDLNAANPAVLGSGLFPDSAD